MIKASAFSFWLTLWTVVLSSLAMGLCAPAAAAAAPIAQVPVELQFGQSVERIDQQASFLRLQDGEKLAAKDAQAAFYAGKFSPQFPSQKTKDPFKRDLWIAVEINNSADGGDPALRQIIGLGGLFVVNPIVYLIRTDGSADEILLSKDGPGQPLIARYFTFLRTQSFDVSSGESALILINTTVNDRPTMGIFREGELGHNQVIATLIKAGFTLTLLAIGITLALVSILTKRRMGLLVAIGFSLVMAHADAPLYSSLFSRSPATARFIWEALTITLTFYIYYLFLFAFRDVLRIGRSIFLKILALALPLPLIWIAVVSDSTPDLLWAYYLSLLLFAGTVGFRFDIARKLRLAAAAVMLLCALAAIGIEPNYLGRGLPDLTVEFLRDSFRLISGLAMLFLVLVDVKRTRAERDRLAAERIAALEVQAETTQQLLETERQYVRARDSALQRKRQLAAASHDIRQPLMGLRSALKEDGAAGDSGLQSRLGEAIDYLEELTREYSDKGAARAEDSDGSEEAYSLNLVLRAVSDMFCAEAETNAITFKVGATNCQTDVPALALMRATSNLVANAMRHSDGNKVHLGVRHRGGCCIIEVRDNGRGMSAEDLQRLRGEGQKGESSEGDGLGLAIVQDLAERHGFLFSIHSAPGGGTKAAIQLSIS